jgi:hypothetical protein
VPAYLSWLLSVLVCAVTVASGYCCFHSVPIKEPNTPGPTISKSWLPAVAMAATARARPAASGNSNGVPSSCLLCAAVGAAVVACLCCCGGAGQALKGLRAVLCLAGQYAAFDD